MQNKSPLTFKDKVFERVRRGPDWLRKPLRDAWWFKKRAAKRLRQWALVFRIFARWKSEPRLLGIYHFQEHGGYLGDMIEYLAILNMLRIEKGLAKVDICYVDDPSNPNQPVTRARVENVPGYKALMLELRVLLPEVGAVFHFGSDRDFEKFFSSHYRRYTCWPTYSYFHTWPSRIDDYNLVPDWGHPYPNTYVPVERFFKAHGKIPKLSCPPAALDWARAFVRAHVGSAVPIAAQIRVNTDAPLRNTDIEAWKEFFRRMEPHTEFKFVVLCRKEEVIPELRALRNIVYAKDHGSGALEDLALIQVCHLSMFPDAGFATFPWFSGLPTISFAKEMYEFAQRRMLDEHGTGLRFLNRFQRRHFGGYGVEVLEKEFWSLWNDLAAAGWQNPHLTGADANR
jgi:hypothetical protein